MRQSVCRLLFLFLTIASTTAMADSSVAAEPEPPAVRQTGNSAEASGCAATRPPIYIEDWGRLAEFTKPDPLVFPQAYRLAARRWRVAWQLGVPFLLGSGAALISGYQRLDNDHWTTANKWGLASGLGLAIVSLVTAWALFPDRDDFLSVVNQWNVRNPDRPVVP